MAEEAVRELNRKEMAILSTLIGNERYGLEILKNVKETGQSLSLAGLYTTLGRLEEAGLVKSWWGDETVAERRGARRRYYKITGVGEKAFIATRKVMQRVFWTRASAGVRA